MINWNRGLSIQTHVATNLERTRCMHSSKHGGITWREDHVPRSHLRRKERIYLGRKKGKGQFRCPRRVEWKDASVCDRVPTDLNGECTHSTDSTVHSGTDCLACINACFSFSSVKSHNILKSLLHSFLWAAHGNLVFAGGLGQR